ncbi:F-box domain-containing protein [Favolaschia claudopus]|uniref:F-box domain-containing protein n=1 Tax=Favolaschia claudopus TaxID=2862362 RepID=A0AAW0AFJ3_9AGAR
MASPTLAPLRKISMRRIIAQQQARIQTASASKAQIQDFISEAESRTSSFTEEIEALQAQIASLFELRDTERAVSAALRHLIAPARSLPVELLRLIFSLAFRHLDAPDSRDFHLSGQRTYHIQDTYRLSHVCSDWRAVALGTPEIWVASPLVVSRSRQSIDSYAEGLEFWFSRSAQLPLSLSLQPSAEAPQILNRILAVASRCRSLRLPKPTTVSASFLLELGNMGRNSLEELEICDEVEQDIGFESISCFTEMPRLRKLTLDFGLPIPMPWAQLTDISFIYTDGEDSMFTILTECKQLVRAHILVQIHRNGFSIAPSLIVLNYLRVLSFDFEQRAFDVMSVFLDCIFAPFLDELCLENPGTLAEDSLTVFQLRSPDITKLSFGGPIINISLQALKNVLRRAPLLTHLSIERCPVYTFEVLTRALASPGSNSQFLVPQLNTLTLTDIMWRDPGLVDAVQSLILARWWTDDEIAAGFKPAAVGPWSRVNIRDVSGYTGESYRISPVVLDGINSLRQFGLDVDIEIAEWNKNVDR